MAKKGPKRGSWGGRKDVSRVFGKTLTNRKCGMRNAKCGMKDKEAAHAKTQRKARLFVLKKKRGSCFAAWREAVTQSRKERQGSLSLRRREGRALRLGVRPSLPLPPKKKTRRRLTQRRKGRQGLFFPREGRAWRLGVSRRCRSTWNLEL
jgi:hypothetical protein